MNLQTTMGIARRAAMTPVMVATLLVLLTTWHSWHELWWRWFSPDDPFSHGWLIGSIAIILLASTTARMDFTDTKPAYIGILPLAGLAAGCHLFNLVSIASLQMALLPLLLLFAYWLVLGWNLTRKLLFPVLFLYFAVPVWAPVTMILQAITTHINGFLLGLGGISFAIDGNQITIPVGTFEVAGGCSGLKYFLTSSSLAALYSYLYLPRNRSRAILLLSAVLLAMLTNWIRVFVIVLVGYFTDMKHPLIKDHNNFGWLLYAASLVPFYFIAHKLTPSALPAAESLHLDRPVGWRGNTVPTLVAALVLGALFGIYLGVERFSAPAIPEWKLDGLTRMPFERQSHWQPEIHGSNAVRMARYAVPGSGTPVLLEQYQFGQPWKDEIKDYRDNYFPDPWQVLQQQSETVDGLGSISVTEIGRRNSRRHVIVLHWFTIDTTSVPSPLKAKLLQAKELASLRYGAALSFLSAPCEIRCDITRKRLLDLLPRLRLINDADSGQ